MLLFIISLGLILIGVIYHLIDDYSDAPIFLIITGVIFTIILSITLPLSRLCTHDEIYQFHAVEKTIELAREDVNYETAALTQTIVSWNAWLAMKKFYKNERTIWFGIFIPEEINELEPLH